jgi:protein O-GlcNAc transferase
LGRGLGLVGEWWLAEQAFQDATNADPRSPEAWAWLGESRQQTGKDGKQELDRALSLDANNTLVRGLRGLYWKRQGKYLAELTEYKRAAQLEPNNPEWQAALGDAYTSSGDMVSALAAYQKATSLAPSNSTYWRLLALFCADNGVQVTDIGLHAGRKAVALAPEDPQALDALGWAFAQAGLLYNAEETLIKATKIAPESALAHVHLAETYLRKGDQSAALHELTAAQKLDADGPTGVLAGQMIHQYFP